MDFVPMQLVAVSRFLSNEIQFGFYTSADGTMRKAVQNRSVNAAYRADMVKELKLMLTMLENHQMGDTFQSKNRTMATGPHTDSAVHTAKGPPKSAAPPVASAAKATTSTTTAADEGVWLEDGTPVKILLGKTDSGAKGGGKEGSGELVSEISSENSDAASRIFIGSTTKQVAT